MTCSHYSILNHGDYRNIWGMSPAERTRKLLECFDNPPENIFELESFSGESILLLKDNVIYDQNYLKGMAKTPDTLFVNQEGLPVGAYIPKNKIDKATDWLMGKGDAPELPVLDPEKTAGQFRNALRKKAEPFALVSTRDNQKELEWYLYKDSYKGVTDIVTKYIWPVPAYHVTRFCARAGVSPNMVTSIGAILMLAALYLFWQGEYGLGLLAAWIMTFLDTVDGKLARCTLTSSKWGNIFDHGIDLIHPPFWYIAWAVGLADYGAPLPEGWLYPVIIVMFVTYVTGRLAEGYFIYKFSMDIHIWRKADSLFRLILARRNPNMIILTISWLFGRPDIGLVLITLWHILTFLVHLLQIAQASMAERSGKRIVSWLAQ